MITALVLLFAACSPTESDDSSSTTSGPYVESYEVRWGDRVTIVLGPQDTYEAQECVDIKGDAAPDDCSHTTFDCPPEDDGSCTMTVVGVQDTYFYIDVYRW